MSTNAEVTTWDVLKAINQGDIDNGTSNIAVCPTFVKAEYNHKRGTEVTMGVPGNALNDIMTGKTFAVLMILDKETYEKVDAEMKRG